MLVTFLGATHEVTGSTSLLQTGTQNILIDFGMEQGANIFENADLPVLPEAIDCILLTHAHIDHSGNIPLLYKNGFRGKVFSTEETASLCEIMLMDSAHIQETEAEWKNRKNQRAGAKPVEAVYTREDAEGAIKLFVPCCYGEMIDISQDIKVRFTDIGHLLGSACIEIWVSEGDVTKKIVFSGDIGNINQPIIKDPKTVDETDYLVIESTYGDRFHDIDQNVNSVEFLADCLQRTFDRGGNVVIPSFAVGRTQEMLYFIRQIKEKNLVHSHDGFKVYVDSPLANAATDIFMHCSETCLDEEALAIVKKGENPLYFDGLEISVTTDESKAINIDTEPKVIISASGMCEAGRIRHHLKHNLWKENSLILFVGYQAAGTLGRIIYEGAKEVKLFKEDIAVKAEIKLMPGISGHADKKGLIKWAEGFKKKPEMIFVNHGEDEASMSFASALKEECGLNAYAPYSGTVYDMAKGEFVEKPQGVRLRKDDTPVKEFVSSEFGNLSKTARRLMEAIEKAKGFSNSRLRDYTQDINELIDQIEN